MFRYFSFRCSAANNLDCMLGNSIVCTLGPSCSCVPVLKQMIQSGMSVARLNFSHGSHDQHKEAIVNVRTAAKELNLSIAIALDTKGPEIRTGQFVAGRSTVAQGDQCVLTTDPSFAAKGTREMFYVDYDHLPQSVSCGDPIYVDDGNLQLRVIGLRGKEVICESLGSWVLKDHRGINLPGNVVALPPVSEKDLSDIRFGMQEQVDFIFASFIRTADHVKEVRRVAQSCSLQKVMIFSKIESQEAVDNIDEIIDESDGVLVARGDLGVEIPLETVVVEQKKITRKCKLKGKPVICATQMLESMTHSPRPTRAEVSDITNAVLDGVDAVMLSAESANGKYPVDAVKWMASISRAAQGSCSSFNIQDCFSNSTADEAICSTAAALAHSIKAKGIVCFSAEVAKGLSKTQIPCPIILVSPDPRSCAQTSVWRYVTGIICSQNSSEAFERVFRFLTGHAYAKKGENVVVIQSVDVAMAHSTPTLAVLVRQIQ